jgi:hypothetical protein
MRFEHEELRKCALYNKHQRSMAQCLFCEIDNSFCGEGRFRAAGTLPSEGEVWKRGER